MDNDGTHGTISAAGDMVLAAGNHKLELLYFKRFGGAPVLKLQWEGGPHKIKRQVFKLKPDWDTIRNSVVVATCKLMAPNMNEVLHSPTCFAISVPCVGQPWSFQYMQNHVLLHDAHVSVIPWLLHPRRAFQSYTALQNATRVVHRARGVAKKQLIAPHASLRHHTTRF